MDAHEQWDFKLNWEDASKSEYVCVGEGVGGYGGNIFFCPTSPALSFKN